MINSKIQQQLMQITNALFSVLLFLLTRYPSKATYFLLPSPPFHPLCIYLSNFLKATPFFVEIYGLRWLPLATLTKLIHTPTHSHTKKKKKNTTKPLPPLFHF